jgi:transcriptional regulator with XRE-family HTH domain
MAKIDVDLGAIVREYRKVSNLTQLELSQKLGYESMQFVSLFERGLSKIPLKVIGKLVVIIGIPEKKITKMLIDHQITTISEEIKNGKKSVSANGPQ